MMLKNIHNPSTCNCYFEIHGADFPQIKVGIITIVIPSFSNSAPQGPLALI